MVMITPIIRTTLKYPDAVGEARIVEKPQEAASLGESRQDPVSTLLWIQIVCVDGTAGNLHSI